MSRTFPIALGLIGALGLSQFPEFAQQYTQRVGGAYEEVAAAATDFRTEAAAQGRTAKQAVAHLYVDDDPAVSAQGAHMLNTLRREETLRIHYDGLRDPEGFNQLYAFVTGVQPKMARDTAEIFKPALPLTFDGGAYAAFGFLSGYFLLRLPMLLFRRRKRSRPAARQRARRPRPQMA